MDGPMMTWETWETWDGSPDWWASIPVLLVVLALLGASPTRWARRAGAWYFTFGSLFIAAFGGLLAAHGGQNTLRGMAKTGSDGLGAMAAGFHGALFLLLFATFGAMVLAAVGALLEARSAASPEPRGGATRRSVLVLALLAALLASAAITCVTLTIRLVVGRHALGEVGHGLGPILSTLSMLLLAALLSSALAMVLSLTGAALHVISCRVEAVRSRGSWLLPTLAFLGALGLALLTHHEMTYYYQVVMTGAIPHSSR